MMKLYEQPEIQIRNYALPPRDVVMTSDPAIKDDNDLNDGDDYDYFG